jgi:DNA-binding SARP family transcriptional activator
LRRRQRLFWTVRVEFPSHLRGVVLAGHQPRRGGTSLTGDRMRFGILGPVLVDDGAVAVAVPAARQRVLLAALLVHAGQAVSADALAEVVWDGSPPPAAAGTLRTHVMRLRRVLGPRAGKRLVTRYPGYLVEADEDEIDLLRFSRMCRDGSAAVIAGSWQQASQILAEALGLWRGPALADVPSQLLQRNEVPRLDQLRLQAQEWRIDADLHLGRHAELVPELQSLAAEYPLRERVHACLLLALYRSGRQAEALAAYRQARGALVEELGAEPGPELQQLHQQILTADPALRIAGPATPTAGGAARPDPPAPPRQLPAAVAGFTGRAAELAALTRMLDQAGADAPGTVVISAVSGTAGVGKTALAVHWAHQVAARFGDGQLYVNLRGFEPFGSPVVPDAAIRGFLDALGLPPGRIPAGAEAQAGLYRGLLAERRMLIILDNASDEQQVRPLLPASPRSLVVVTSRNQLSGLAAANGAQLLTLDVLRHTEAVQMLAARLGSDRAGAEPAAIDRIARLCACLPLALAIAAAGPPPGPGSRWPPSPPSLVILRGAWTPWMPVTRLQVCGWCSPGPPGSSPARQRGCSGCWACTPAPTSPSRRQLASPTAPSRRPADCWASWPART